MAVIGLFILVMAGLVAVMICLSPRRRVIGFFLGLVFAWDFALLARFADEFIFMLLVPAGVMISLAALLVEIPAFVIRTIRR